MRPDGDSWIAETAQGLVRVRFAASNAFGVLDHYVRPVAGREIAVPMRVVPNGAGSEVLITVFQQPEQQSHPRQADAHHDDRSTPAATAGATGNDCGTIQSTGR